MRKDSQFPDKGTISLLQHSIIISQAVVMANGMVDKIDYNRI